MNSYKISGSKVKINQSFTSDSHTPVHSDSTFKGISLGLNMQTSNFKQMFDQKRASLNFTQFDRLKQSASNSRFSSQRNPNHSSQNNLSNFSQYKKMTENFKPNLLRFESNKKKFINKSSSNLVTQSKFL